MKKWDNIPSSLEGDVEVDSSITDAVAILNSIIARPETPFLARLSYAQLTQVLDTLKENVRHCRRLGLIDRVSGKRIATLAIDIYLSAKDTPTDQDRKSISKLM